MPVDYTHRQYPNRLKVIRQNAGYTQQYVARILRHKNSNALCLWEREKVMPNGINLLKLCLLYNKTPRQLYPEYCEHLEQDFIA